MNNIFILEDTLHVASSTKMTLENLDYRENEIFHAKTFISADYFIDEIPGWHSFKAFIVDLNIPCDYSAYFSKDELKELDNISKNSTSDNVRLGGWIWIKRLIKRFHNVADKIIILSAYVNEIPESEKKMYGEKMEFFDKTDRETVEKLRGRLDTNKR